MPCAAVFAVEDTSRTLGGVSAADWATVAQDSFPADDVNQYNHLRLSDFTDAVNMLPREEMQAAMAAGGMADVQVSHALKCRRNEVTLPWDLRGLCIWVGQNWCIVGLKLFEARKITG